MANHGHDVTMPARLGAHDAKTVLGVVVGYSLDEAREHFLGRRFRLRPHLHYPVPPSGPSKPVAWGCLAASGFFLKLRTRRGSRASSLGCKTKRRRCIAWNFDAGFMPSMPVHKRLLD